MISEFTAIDWLGRGWLLLLAFTVAVLLVAALRNPCRYLFGTERAFQLWLLPPLAMLASQWPHATVAPVTMWSSITSTLASAVIVSPMSVASAHVVDWRLFAVIMWLVGIVVSLLIAMRAQTRYRKRLQGALPMVGPALSCPVVRATTTDIGPALVGAWRSRIVLPADFERRYDETEQALILAHEATHARRRDGWWCLFARLIAAGFWFHPLAWWALRALRHDQELACDAAVLREHGSPRRSYAAAMLKTQSAAIALPVGCPWSPRHPITERIAMLKLKQPGTMRRRAGGGIVVLIAVGLASAVYAATPARQTTVAASHADQYTLKLALALDGKPARLHATACLRPGEYYSVTENGTGNSPAWHGRFTVAPAERGELEVQGELSGGSLTAPSHPKLRMLPGQHGTIQVGQQAHGKRGLVTEDHTIKIDITPSMGC